MSDFINDFDPSRGDLVYGLATSRSEMVKRYKAHWESVAEDPDHAGRAAALEKLAAMVLTTCDHFNNHYQLADPASYVQDKLLKKQLKDKTKLTANTVDGGAMNPAQQARMKAYAKDIRGSRFSPVKAMGASDQKLDEEGASPDSWQDEPQQMERIKNAKSVNVTQLAIRRACKFGIGLVAKSSAFKNAKVHFLLDGLVMREVVDNRANTSAWLLPGGETKESINITISELRYVYRNWGKLSSTVILYVNGNRVTAPWLADWKDQTTCHPRRTKISAEKTGWDEYASQRSDKYPDKLPKKSLTA